MKHVAGLGIALLAFWLLLSGLYGPLFIGLGIASVALVLWLTLRMDTADHESVPLHLGPRILRYWAWLVVEIAKSNVDVARRVLSPSLPVSPCDFEIRASQRTALGRTIYANSITLTPGTVSMSVDGDRIRVHALTKQTRAALEEGEMDRRVTAVEEAGRGAAAGSGAPAGPDTT
jgi:multicomponent Na+:H+ antiporter subunit E